MLLGPKSILGLGSPAALRAVATTPNKGVGGNVLRSRADGQPLRSRVTEQYLMSRSV